MFTAVLARSSSMIMLAGLPLMAGCGAAPTIMLDENANGRQIELAPNQTLVVTLPANPTTGYSWEIAALDPEIVQQAGEATFTPMTTDQARVGAGGTETFQFTAVGPGTTTLTLVYHRPWEKDVAPLQTYSLQLAVA